MGSRSRTDLAYIAGFLDGDGSLMLQVKKRKDGRLKRRFMCTICFYQDSRHEKPLHWIRKTLGIGYLSRRNDGISELRINGFAQTKRILTQLLPFLRFKKAQALAMLKAANILSTKYRVRLTRAEALRVVGYLSAIQRDNYATQGKKTKERLLKMLDLTP